MKLTAIDQFGQTATTTLTFDGVPPSNAIDANDLEDISTLGSLAYSHTTFRRVTCTLHADVQLTNLGDDRLTGPVLAAVDPVRPLRVELASPAGELPDGRPHITFDTQLPIEGLPSGTTSTAIPVAFSNPSQSRFDFDVTLLATGNAPPRFTSSPPVSVVAGLPYRYQAVGTDANLRPADIPPGRCPRRNGHRPGNRPNDVDAGGRAGGHAPSGTDRQRRPRRLGPAVVPDRSPLESHQPTAPIHVVTGHSDRQRSKITATCPR